MTGKVTQLPRPEAAETTQTGLPVVSHNPLPPAMVGAIEPLISGVAALLDKLESAKDGGGNGGSKRGIAQWIGAILTLLLSIGGSYFVAESHEPETPIVAPAAATSDDLSAILKRLDSIEETIEKRERDRDYLIQLIGAAVLAQSSGPDVPDEVARLKFELLRKQEVKEVTE